MRDTSADPDLFNFEFSDPEPDTLTYWNHREYSFSTEFTNRSTGEATQPETSPRARTSFCLFVSRHTTRPWGGGSPA